jgi:acyl carrier protein
LVSRLSEVLGIESREIDVREPFASYGLGSTEMVILSGELAEWLGRQLSPALPYEYSTVETLARHLAGSADAASAVAVDHEQEATTSAAGFPEPLARKRSGNCCGTRWMPSQRFRRSASTFMRFTTRIQRLQVK